MKIKISTSVTFTEEEQSIIARVRGLIGQISVNTIGPIEEAAECAGESLDNLLNVIRKYGS